MTAVPSEIDAVILGILLKSEHGRRWLERAAEKQAMERRLRSLLRSGLDQHIVTQLWMTADIASLDMIEAATPKQIKAINREYRARLSA